LLGRDIGPGDDFYWGAATAAYQVEGYPLADGAGSCVWHEFSHTPGTTHGGDTGDVATDHYHRWAQDICVMRQLGLNAYRFSVRWPRVLPEGVGRLNQVGLGFYDRLVDALLTAGLEPFVTLYHWDLPSAIQRRGGWSNPDVASWFGEYAATITSRLGDRVQWWTTLNEPFVVAEQGHLVGAHAPGIRNIYAAGHAGLGSCTWTTRRGKGTSKTAAGGTASSPVTTAKAVQAQGAFGTGMRKTCTGGMSFLGGHLLVDAMRRCVRGGQELGARAVVAGRSSAREPSW
jgi:beta-glucosidase/6-phospho-beta-glucosidase/beta-galactosidase